mmetsp:Transcript_13669/g.22780  ORF Transcript_13669/g.22780 Transcript_13669/m.22780 type:complete len:585 (+) Transcript_13669:107-1861(+)
MFGFGSSNADLSTPVGILIKSATDSLLLGPDWSKNLEICDMVSHERDAADQAVRALIRRLRDNDENTVHLAMIIAEACMKNGAARFAPVAHQKLFLDEFTSIARGGKGSRNSTEALRLIQQWGRAFEQKRDVMPMYFENFMSMRSSGFLFPENEETPSMTFEVAERVMPFASDGGNSGISSGINGTGNPPAMGAAPSASRRGSGAGSGSGGSSSEGGANGGDQKLRNDLRSVMEKVTLCREMLQVSSGIQEDDALAEVVGFLEACRDRMGELIDAGAEGQLTEDLFAECLKVNDSVHRTLEAERTGIPISVDDDGTGSGEEAATGSIQKQPSTNLIELDTPPPVTAGTAGDLLDDGTNEAPVNITANKVNRLAQSSNTKASANSTGSTGSAVAPVNAFQQPKFVASVPPPPGTGAGTGTGTAVSAIPGADPFATANTNNNNNTFSATAAVSDPFAAPLLTPAVAPVSAQVSAQSAIAGGATAPGAAAMPTSSTAAKNDSILSLFPADVPAPPHAAATSLPPPPPTHPVAAVDTSGPSSSSSSTGLVAAAVDVPVPPPAALSAAAENDAEFDDFFASLNTNTTGT